MSDVLRAVGVHAFLPDAGALQELSPLVCAADRALCDAAIALFTGESANFDSARLGACLSHMPAGTSVQNMLRYARALRREGFRAMDHGCERPARAAAAAAAGAAAREGARAGRPSGGDAGAIVESAMPRRAGAGGAAERSGARALAPSSQQQRAARASSCANAYLYGAAHARRPPAFNLSALDGATALAVFSGSKDPLVSAGDVQALVEAVPRGSLVLARELEGYAHLDFIWAESAHRELFPKVVEALQGLTAGGGGAWRRSAGGEGAGVGGGGIRSSPSS